MKIVVKGDAEKSFRLLLPTGIALNGVSAAIISAALRKRKVQISAARLRGLFREIRRYKQGNPEWTFVDVQSADGVHVTIKL